MDNESENSACGSNQTSKYYEDSFNDGAREKTFDQNLDLQAGYCVFNEYLKSDQAALAILKQQEVPEEAGRPPDINKILQDEIYHLLDELKLVLDYNGDMDSQILLALKRNNDLRRIIASEVNEEPSIDQFETNVTKVRQNLRKQFINDQKLLKATTEVIFHDDADSKDILSTLLKSAVDEPEAYCTFPEGRAAAIEMLLGSGTVETHPSNPLKVRICDLFK